MQETQLQSNPSCKYCGGNAIVKFGTYKDVQRYWCKVCQRKFKGDDTTYTGRPRKRVRITPPRPIISEKRGVIR